MACEEDSGCLGAALSVACSLEKICGAIMFTGDCVNWLDPAVGPHLLCVQCEVSC